MDWRGVSARQADDKGVGFPDDIMEAVKKIKVCRATSISTF